MTKKKTICIFGVLVFALSFSTISALISNHSLHITQRESPQEFLNSPEFSSAYHDWNKTWGSSINEWGNDMATYKAEFGMDRTRYLYIVGTIDSPIQKDICLIKYNANGEKQWEITWGTPYDDVDPKVEVNKFGDIIVAGTSEYPTANGMRNCIFLVKFNSSGIVQWEHVYLFGNMNDYCGDIIIEHFLDIYVVGTRDRFTSAGAQALVILFDISGHAITFQEWGGSEDDKGCAIALDSTNNYLYITGKTESYGFGKYDVFLLKFTLNLQLEWSRTCGGSNNDSGDSIFLDSSDNIYIGGNTLSYGAGDNDFYLIKYDKSGNRQWFLTNGESGYDYCRAIIIDPRDNIYLAGETINYGAGNIDVYLVKYNKMGEYQWNTTWGGINDDLNTAICIGEWDELYLGGSTYSFGAGGSDIFILNLFNPEIVINQPNSGEIFQWDSPNYDIFVNNGRFTIKWYTLNDGQRYYFSPMNGKIDQSAWSSCSDGSVKLKFYARSSIDNRIISDEVIINKDTTLEVRRAYAIIVGVEDYPGTVNDLDYCVDDANSIYSKLHNQYGFREDPSTETYLLLNSEATKDEIIDAFQMVSFIIDSDDIFLFYFSGHGTPGSVTNYIYPYDGITDSNKRISDTELDMYLDWVSCSEQYIIIDSCGSGGMIDEAQASNRFFMTACEKLEVSWETSALDHGVFTYYFLRSFSYASDSNSDGILSLEEQFTYTYSHTVSYTTNMGDVQHPQVYDGVPGETVINTELGSLTFTVNGTQLNYSFYLYGHGSLTTLYITICCIGENVTIENFNLIPEAPPSTGFGHYSGMVEASCGENITGFKISGTVYFWIGNTKEIQHSFDEDYDGDGLPNILEISEGLDPKLNDTDYDDLSDYEEYYGPTDPLLNDTDDDGMLDGFEVHNGLDPLIDDADLDLDNDQLSNIFEYFLGSEPDDPDTDHDGMEDGYEYNCDLDIFNDDAQLDYDNDTLSNLLEFQIGSIANDSDTDDDTMPDGWEYNHGLNLTMDDTNLDPDNDLLINIYEYTNNTHPNDNDTDNDGLLDGLEIIEHGTNPLLEDTDSDGMPDGWEVTHLLNPLADDSALDPDVDDLTNLQEFQIGTDPQNPDTDGDTFTDGDEVLHGTDPLDPDDYPRPSEDQIPSYNPLLLLGVIVLSILFLTKRKLKISKN